MKEAGKNTFYTIIGIIQSLAFVQLMEISFANIEIVSYNGSLSYEFSLDNWILIVHSVIGFLIIIRLFTTLLFAVEDYSDFVLGMYELFLIFLIGALEFYLFNALDNFNAGLFYFRFSIIAVFTFIGYLIALIKVIRQGHEKVKNYKIERNLQMFNNVGGVFILIVLQTIAITCDISPQSLLIISIISAIIIFVNILFSYKYSMIQDKEVKEPNEVQ